MYRTRPGWNEDKKKKFRAAADIPIVILNPFGLLDVKAESEEKLRRSGACISNRILGHKRYLGIV